MEKTEKRSNVKAMNLLRREIEVKTFLFQGSHHGDSITLGKTQHKEWPNAKIKDVDYVI